MKWIITSLMLSVALIPTEGAAQTTQNQLPKFDTTTIIADTGQSKVTYVLPNGIDTLLLDPLPDAPVSPFTGLVSFDEPKEGRSGNKKSNSLYSFNYNKEKTKVVDSLDLNNDGYKEMILFRENNSSGCPPNPGAYGVGCHRQTSQKYEVWDVKNKNMLLELNSYLSWQVTVSTNVINGDSFKCDIELDKKGTFHVKNIKNTDSLAKEGTYRFDGESYRLKE